MKRAYDEDYYPRLLLALLLFYGSTVQGFGAVSYCALIGMCIVYKRLLNPPLPRPQRAPGSGGRPRRSGPAAQ
jgi:hypothetical protein